MAAFVELTEEEKREAVEMYKRGVSLDDIARHQHHQNSKISLLINRMIANGELERRPAQPNAHQWTAEEILRVVKLRKKGYSWTYIGKELGISAEACRYQYNKTVAPNKEASKPGRRPGDKPAKPKPIAVSKLDKWQTKKAVETAKELYGTCTTDELINKCAGAVGVTRKTMQRELPRVLRKIARGRK